MAKAKKGARHIVIRGVRYCWRAKGDDMSISLVIWPDDLPGAVIASMLGYHQDRVPFPPESPIQGFSLTRQIVVTNRIVRQVIEHALEHHAYDPHVKRKQLNLRRVDDVVDLSTALRSA